MASSSSLRAQPNEVSQRSLETGTPLPPTRHDLVVTFARHNRSLPGLNGALRTAPRPGRRRPHAGPNTQRARGSTEARAPSQPRNHRPRAQLPGDPAGPGRATWVPGGPRPGLTPRPRLQQRGIPETLRAALPGPARATETSRARPPARRSRERLRPRPRWRLRSGKKSSLLLAGDDEAEALAAGLGRQKELERLTLRLQNNCLGRGPQLRSSFAF